MYEIKRAYTNMVDNGLGFWVFYIIRSYFQVRNIPVVMFIKSVTKGMKIEKMEKFIKRNKIDAVIPSDVTDTWFCAEHIQRINAITNIALTPSLDIYKKLEDKWQTYEFCTEHGVPTPETKKLADAKEEGLEFPFFLKISSGTNGGRGVWLVRDQEAFDKAMAEKLNVECAADPDNLHLVQAPTFGKIICSEVVYSHGKPIGFWFAQSTNADDLAGVGIKYMCGCMTAKSGEVSHVKVELTDDQWAAVTQVFHDVGSATKYHGMIDIEFIVAGPDNKNVEEGSVWLLEMNPRFSGDIHTTLSNPGFLDLYFDIVFDRANTNAPVINFTRGVEMKADFKQWSPGNFYASHPRAITNVRNWNRFGDVAVKGKHVKGDKTPVNRKSIFSKSMTAYDDPSRLKKSIILQGKLPRYEDFDDDDDDEEGDDEGGGKLEDVAL